MHDRKAIALVYGVQSIGQWPASVKPILESAGYDCHVVEYSGYATSGFARAVARPWGYVLFPIAAILCLIWAGWAAFRGSIIESLIVFVAGGIALFIYWPARKRAIVNNDKTCRIVEAQLNDVIQQHQRPVNVIAHSFGTFIVGDILHNKKPLRLGDIIFFGSVLSCFFRWRKLSTVRFNGDSRERWVTNEIGILDPVPILALLGGVFIRGLGCSGGILGFTSRSANNRWLLRFHSGQEKCIDHVRNRWLPALWGIDHRLYRKMCRMSQKLLKLERDQDIELARKLSRSFGLIEGFRSKFGGTSWCRSKPGSLDETIRMGLERHDVEPEEFKILLAYKYFMIELATPDNWNSPVEKQRSAVDKVINPPRGSV